MKDRDLELFFDMEKLKDLSKHDLKWSVSSGKQRRAMTEKKFEDIKVGDVIADMHDGEDQLRKRFDIVFHAKWRETQDEAPFHMDFYDYVHQFTTHHPTNKLLYVIGREYGEFLVCAYCYDGRRSGMILLADKRN
jgi:hypothetical protein